MNILKIKYSFKLLLLAIIMVVSIKYLNGQNLVDNSSFEYYNDCPNPNTNGCEISYLDIDGWKTYSRSPDYYNSCSSDSLICSVPLTGFGYQLAATGVSSPENSTI
jgi:hypothetical protein